MRSTVASILILAFVGSALTHHHHHHHHERRRLNNKPAYDDDSDSGFGKFGKGFDFASVNNASLKQSATSGHTLAVGKGETSISSSIGNSGTINNVKATKGGQSAADFSQVGKETASSQSLKKDKNGNVQKVDNASDNNYAVKGSNQAAFLGNGHANTGVGVDGVVSNVYGKDGAANANSFDSVLKNQASASATAQAGAKKTKHHHHDDDDSDSSDSSDKKSKKKNNKKNNKKDDKKNAKHKCSVGAQRN